MVILLAILVLAPSLSKLVVIGYYYSNMEYIANELCINSEKADSDCHGKCYLNEKITEIDTKDRTLPEVITLKESLLFIDDSIQFIFKITIIEENVPSNVKWYSYQYTSQIFHPPIIIS